jgi:DNA-binding XRE family transcriptional regulator
MAQALTQAELGRKVGHERETIRKLEAGIMRLSVDWARKLAPHVKMSAEILAFGEPSVPLIGYVGRGLKIRLTQQPKSQKRQAKMPPNGSGKTVGVEIRDDALGAAFHGWVAYFDNRREPPTDALIDRLCVVALNNGDILIRRLLRSHLPGHFDLWAPNQPPMQDQRVEWAALITAILPPSAL